MARQDKIAVWEQHKVWRGGRSFSPLVHEVFQSPLYYSLSARAKALLVEFLAQYNGYNNGDFSAVYSDMKNKGWNSPTTLNEARKELLDVDLIITTRQGGKNKCSLFGLSFLAINECGGKLDVKATEKPPDNWKKHNYILMNQSKAP